MVQIREAYHQDFEQAYPLLMKEFNFDALPPSTKKRYHDSFAQLFKQHWHSPKDFIGYLLYEGEAVVGFMAYIFSERTINGIKYPYCNFSSWAVDKKFRFKSILLASPIRQLKAEKYTLINLTPSKAAHGILTQLHQFKVLETGQWIIPYLPTIPFLSSNKCWFNNQIPVQALTPQELTDFNEVNGYDAQTLYVKNDTSACLIIYKRVYKKRIPFSYILHISNAEFFLKNLPALRSVINLANKTPAILLDSRLVNHEKIKFAHFFQLAQPKIYWSESLSPQQIDNLYSENLFE
jgi:hypothetical protein